MLTRRSNRQSGISTPAEPAGPTFTASGRQVRSRFGGAYGEATLTKQYEDGSKKASENTEHVGDEEGQSVTYGRGQRSAGRSARVRNHKTNFKSYDGTDEDSAAPTSGEEWEGGDDADADDQMVHNADDEELEMSDDEFSAADNEEEEKDNEEQRSSLIVSLKYQGEASPRPSLNGLHQREDPPTNGVQGPTPVASVPAAGSDVQAQQAQHPFQTFTLRPGSHSQEAKPAMQDHEGDPKQKSSGIKEIPPTFEQARHSRPLAPA